MFKKILFIFTSVLLILVSGFFIYGSHYYKADDLALAALQTGLKNNGVKAEDDFILIPAKEKTNTALIFYPGAKVEAAAYYPLMSKLSDQGITCILVKMPFHLAVFNASAADRFYEKFPEITNWYVGGHSLGGAMASSYMAKNPDKLKGTILLGAYIYGDVSPSKVLTVYGTEDGVLNMSKINYRENVVSITGGNHANFGNYGKQKKDHDGFISREEQQEQTINAIYTFIEKSNSQT